MRPTTRRRAPFGRGLRRLVALGCVLGLTALVVPDSAVTEPSTMLVRTHTARGVDHSADVVWVLALGSDARPGQDPLASRADAIQLIGVNLVTGAVANFGVPRDSWVPIEGYGSNRVNAALFYGGPALMGQTVGALFGIQPDYVFTTTFRGFVEMVRSINGITVDSRLAFSDDNLPGSFEVGPNRLKAGEALNFGRMRHFLPRGDFDRSANQQALLLGILERVRQREDQPGFMERGMLSVLHHLMTDASPSDLYRLAQAATVADPAKFRSCVLDGSITTIGGASVILPDTAQANRLGDSTRDDARLEGPC